MQDDLVQRNSRMLVLEEPHPQHVQSLQNWLAGNACIARDEAEFLHREKDLASFSRPDDYVISWLERFLSSLLRCLQIVSTSVGQVSSRRQLQKILIATREPALNTT